MNLLKTTFLSLLFSFALLSAAPAAASAECSYLLRILNLEETNQQGEGDWPIHRFHFWDDILRLGHQSPNLNTQWVPKRFHAKTIELKASKISLGLLETVGDGLANMKNETYPVRIEFYKDPSENFPEDKTLVREPYRFLHVTRAKIAELILSGEPKFSPGVEMVETSPGSGKKELSPRGQFFYSAFFTSMDRSYLEGYGSRILSKDKGKYNFDWDDSEPLAPVMIEIKTNLNAKVLDLRKGFYEYGQGTFPPPGRDAYYDWYLSLSDQKLESILQKLVGSEFLKKYPLIENSQLWRAPQTFAHLVGADIVHYEAGLSRGTVAELNIINPDVITDVEIEEAPLIPYFLRWKSSMRH